MSTYGSSKTIRDAIKKAFGSRVVNPSDVAEVVLYQLGEEFVISEIDARSYLYDLAVYLSHFQPPPLPTPSEFRTRELGQKIREGRKRAKAERQERERELSERHARGDFRTKEELARDVLHDAINTFALAAFNGEFDLPECVIPATRSTPGLWKRRGDLTAQDCRTIAGRQRREGAAHLAQAERYDQLAEFIEARGVETYELAVTSSPTPV